jgi:hypothetical protein
MVWFGEHVFVGTARANLHLLKIAMPIVRIDMWPVERLHTNYSPEFEREAARGEIWCYHPPTRVWSRVYRSPLVKDADGVEFSRRDLGYRAMAVFQGASGGIARRPASGSGCINHRWCGTARAQNSAGIWAIAR